jgi:hypothetical protein
MAPGLNRYRRWIAAAFGMVALAEVIALGLRASGVEGRIALGPFLIIIHSVYKPLWVGLAASLVMLAVAHNSSLDRRIAVALMGTLIALALIALARTSPAIVTKSDIAVTELYVQLAAKGQLLSGPYSRFGWHHPGPLYFWIQVPFYALSGDKAVGLYAGALAINLAALVVLAWVLMRVDGGVLAIAVLAGWLLFTWRDRFIVASPWTGHIPVLATMTFVVIAAAVASGRSWMLPLLILFGSLMAQSHVALVPLVGVLTAAALITTVIIRRDHVPRLSPILHTSAWLFAALWLLPIAEQLSHTPGNLFRLWRFFVTGAHAAQAYSTAFATWSYALVGGLRPDLYTPYGGHFEITHLRWGVPLAVAELIALAAIAAHARRARRAFEASMACMALLAGFVSLWSITRIRGDIVDHEVYWIVPLGAMNLGIIAAAGLRSISARWPGAQWRRWVPVNMLGVALMLACVGIGFRDFDRLTAFERSKVRKDADIAATYEAIRGYLDSEDIRKPLFEINAMWDVAAAVLVRLHQSGRTFAVEDGAVLMFTDAFSAHGDEDAVVAIGRREGMGGFEPRGRFINIQNEPVPVEGRRLER